MQLGRWSGGPARPEPRTGHDTPPPPQSATTLGGRGKGPGPRAQQAPARGVWLQGNRVTNSFWTIENEFGYYWISEFALILQKFATGDNLGPNSPKNIKNKVRTKNVHTPETFFRKTYQKRCLDHVPMSNTTNSNSIFKITIYYTKYTQNAKMHFDHFENKKWNMKNKKEKRICYIYKFHNSYFVILVYFVF